MRLQKYIAQAGIASRRAAEKLIVDGKVTVGGEVVRELGTKVDPDRDMVSVNGKMIEPEKKKIYIVLNKPPGYLTTVSDDRGRKTIMELTGDIRQRIYPIGRLDMDSEGMLLMTSDGNFANLVMHPKNKIVKTYLAKVKGLPELSALEKLSRGVTIEDYKTAPAKFTLITGEMRDSMVRVEIAEGKNRQIRKMFDLIGHPVLSLKRVAIGDLGMGHLPRGKWRHLVASEINYLTKNYK